MIDIELAIAPFALLAAAIPGALQLGQTLINKPKRDDFKPNTAGMEKYISYLRGKSAKSEVAHQTMQPQLRAIGAQNRQTERKIQSAVGRGNLSASEEAQLQISQGQAASQATQAVGEQASALQVQENRRIGEQVAQAQARIAQAKEQGNLDFERATKDYKNQIKGSLLNIGGSVASAGISDYLTKQATSKSAFDAYKAAGLSEYGTAEELAKASVDAGIGDPRQLVNMKLNEQKVKSAFSGFSPEEISAAGQKLYGTSEFDIGKDLSTEGAQQLLTELSGQRTNAIMDVSQKIANNEITSVDQIKQLNLSDPVKLQLANQLAQQKASLADPIDRAIGGAIQTRDKAKLVKIMETPDISEKDYKTALNAHTSIVNAEIKEAVATQKEIAARAEVKPEDVVKMGKFTTRAIELEGKLELDLLNLKKKGLKVGDGYAGSELLGKISKLKDKTNVTPEELSDLSTRVNKWIESLDLENTGLLSAFGDIETFEEGIPKGVGVKRKLKNEYSSLIRQIADNSVTLTQEQQSTFQSAIDPAGLGF